MEKLCLELISSILILKIRIFTIIPFFLDEQQGIFMKSFRKNSLSNFGNQIINLFVNTFLALVPKDKISLP